MFLQENIYEEQRTSFPKSFFLRSFAWQCLPRSVDIHSSMLNWQCLLFQQKIWTNCHHQTQLEIILSKSLKESYITKIYRTFHTVPYQTEWIYDCWSVHGKKLAWAPQFLYFPWLGKFHLIENIRRYNSSEEGIVISSDHLLHTGVHLKYYQITCINS